VRYAGLRQPGDVIEVRELTKRYGTALAVDRLSFRADRGA